MLPGSVEKPAVRAREELLAKGWAEVAETQRTSGTPYYAVLRFRSEHPDLRSPEIAEEVGKQLGKSLTSASIRVLSIDSSTRKTR